MHIFSGAWGGVPIQISGRKMTSAFEFPWNMILQSAEPGLDLSGAVVYQKPLHDVIPSPLPLPFPGAYLLHPSQSDLELLAGLLQATYGLNGDQLPALRRRLRDFFSRETARPLLDCSWMCFADGIPVSACLVALSHGSATPQIVDLATALPWQGHGLGTVVMQKSFHTLVEKGFSAVRLICSESATDLNQKLESLGFVIINV